MRALVPFALLTLVSAPSLAEEKPHFTVGAGGHLALAAGDALGGWAGMSFVAAGSRWGARADVWTFGVGAPDQTMAEAGVAFQLGATRPHLAVLAHGGGGVRFPDATATLFAGLAAQIRITGPLCLAWTTSAHLTIESDPRPILTSALGLLLAF